MRNCTRVNCPCGFYNTDVVYNCKLHHGDMEQCKLRKHTCPTPVISNDSLSDNGILFQVNNRVLHPIGMALTIEGNSMYVADCRDGGIYFGTDTARIKEEAYAKFIKS